MSTLVMIVDASVAVRREAASALASAGFTVIEAADAQEALQRVVAAEQVALVICDVGTEPATAIEFIDELSIFMGDSAPPVVLSTEGHAELGRLARACGAQGCILKPFNIGILVAIARRLTLAIAA